MLFINYHEVAATVPCGELATSLPPGTFKEMHSPGILVDSDGQVLCVYLPGLFDAPRMVCNCFVTYVPALTLCTQAQLAQTMEPSLDKLDADAGKAYPSFVDDIADILAIMGAITDLFHPEQAARALAMRDMCPRDHCAPNMPPSFQGLSVNTSFNTAHAWESPRGGLDARLFVEAKALYRIETQTLNVKLQCDAGTLVLCSPRALTLTGPERPDIVVLGLHAVQSWYDRYKVEAPGHAKIALRRMDNGGGVEL